MLPGEGMLVRLISPSTSNGKEGRPKDRRWLMAHPKIIKSLRLRGSNVGGSHSRELYGPDVPMTVCLMLFNPSPSLLQEQKGVSLFCR